MKISAEILELMCACRPGFKRFVAVHGASEIQFTDCIRSGSNTIADYLWYIRHQYSPNVWVRDIALFAYECSDIALGGAKKPTYVGEVVGFPYEVSNLAESAAAYARSVRGVSETKLQLERLAELVESWEIRE